MNNYTEIISNLQNEIIQLRKIHTENDAWRKACIEISQNLQDTSGKALLDMLTVSLCRLLQVDYSFIAAWAEPKDINTQHIDTVSVCKGGEIVDNFTYPLSPTPFLTMLRESFCFFPSRVQLQYPDDAFLKDLGAEGYAGVPIYNSRNKVIGILVLIHSRPLKNQPFIQSILKLLSSIASKELERIRLEKELHHRLYFDSLTGLYNKHMLQTFLLHKMKQAELQSKSFALLFISLDAIKSINLSLGYEIGNQLLRQATMRIKRYLRESDLIARWGDNEIILLLSPIQGLHEVRGLAKKLLRAFQQPFIVHHVEMFSTLSIGISIFPDAAEEPLSLIKKANIAMTQVQMKGRNHFKFYQADQEKYMVKRLGIETRLRKALEKREFILHYQPQVDIKTGEIQGLEALVRWQHPELGLIPPSDFIPVAEETGLIVDLDDWILQTVCYQNKEWQDQGYHPISVKVNISAYQFKQKRLARSVDRILKATQLDPKYLGIEVTENISLYHMDAVKSTLDHLHALGIELAIDDFGTGHSSLSYLKDFPVHVLKIDQSFIRDISEKSENLVILKKIIELAHSLDLKVVAEGIEHKEQLSYLRHQQCDQIQGYYISHPLPKNEIELLMRKRVVLFS